MLARVTTFAIDGLDSRRITVEADVPENGLPAFYIVGLADKAVREARERVRAAIEHSGLRFPGVDKRITVNLAPASMRKSGPAFDLPIAIAILAAAGLIPKVPPGFAFCGELSLNGELRPIRGALILAEGTRESDLDAIVVAEGNLEEASLIEGVTAIAATSLREVIEVIEQPRERLAVAQAEGFARTQASKLDRQAAHARGLPGPCDRRGARPAVDLAEVRGQAAAVEALIIAAAGAHNLLMLGPPGTGKTMLARRLPTILPPMTEAEALDVSRIHSIREAGRIRGLPTVRPFRAPHHAISSSGLVGGSAPPQPGEATLAHHGVLFLDELSEFPRPSLEALRQPLEDGRVVVVRGNESTVFPTRFMLVAASNPCPCGFRDDGTGRCRCAPGDLARHDRKLSGPLRDRLDLVVTVSRPTSSELDSPAHSDSATARARVLDARRRQLDRYEATGITTNAELTPTLAATHGRVEPAVGRLLRLHYERGTISARGMTRILRVARTVADLAGSETVDESHAATALALRIGDIEEKAAA